MEGENELSSDLPPHPMARTPLLCTHKGNKSKRNNNKKESTTAASLPDLSPASHHTRWLGSR